MTDYIKRQVKATTDDMDERMDRMTCGERLEYLTAITAHIEASWTRRLSEKERRRILTRRRNRQ